MKISDAVVGQRIRSHSNGFTGGWTGTIRELCPQPWPGSHPDSFLVVWDNGMEAAVAVSFVEPLVLS